MQYTITLLCHKSRCWLVVKLVSTRTPWIIFCKAVPNQLLPSKHCCRWLFLPKCRTLCFPLLNCEVPASPFLQLVEFVLGGSTTLWRISCSFQFCVMCRLAECSLSPITQMIN